MTAKPHDAVAVTENLSPSISTFTDSPFLQQPSATLCAAPLLSNPHSRACLLLRGLVQHVLSPAATLALSPRLDCLQALRDKTLYVSLMIGVMGARATKTCDECGSQYYREASRMDSLCPECAHILYGYEPCAHTFIDGRCSRCHWDGSVSDYCRSLKDGV
jgi:hypothetical protein